MAACGSVAITGTALQVLHCKLPGFERDTHVNTVLWPWATSCSVLQVISGLLCSMLHTSRRHN